MAKKKLPQTKPAPVRADAPTRGDGAARGLPTWKKWLIPGLTLLFFLMNCLTGDATEKGLGLVLFLLALISCLIRWNEVTGKLSLPVLSVFLWVLMNGVSVFYAVSGLFALRSFLFLSAGFCVFLLILAWAGRESGSRAVATVLAGSTALAGLVSIDALSTHLLSTPWLALMDLIAGGNSGLSRTAVETGVRMVSIYANPNSFAGLVGLGVLLSLGLAVTAEGRGERRYHRAVLFVNALAFVLAFSMGASGMIALGFLVFLLLERKGRRPALFLLMVETLVLTLGCAFPIFLTSFDGGSGFQPVPLLCALGGAALLSVADELVGERLTKALEGRGKLLAAAVAVILALMAGYGVAAFNLAGAAHLSAGESLSRSEYPAPGTYTMTASFSGGEVSADSLQVQIISQNMQQAMMHTNTVLYSGRADSLTFTVPEDSRVVHFQFQAKTELTLSEAVFTGEEGSTALKLSYTLLPGFIANRLQGLFANQNAIQRTVFFADGMKLFRRSPIFGLGIGAYENGILSVQDFFYETKYAHDHYIETLVTTGVVGLVLFVGVLVLLAAALWKNLRRGDEAHPLSPALAAALVFMAAHAVVEIIFSFNYYLPTALGVFGLICLCCGEELPLPGAVERARSWILGVLCGLMAVFAVLLMINMSWEDKIDRGDYQDPYAALEQAVKWDRFDWSSYMLSYVYAAKNVDDNYQRAIREKADAYAERLSVLNSNTIPRYLADYYFATGRLQNAYAMLEKYVGYCSSNSTAWQQAFSLLELYSGGGDLFQEGAERLYEMFVTWDEGHIGSLTLSDANESYLSRMGLG